MTEWKAMQGDYAALRNALDARDLVRSITDRVLPALNVALPPTDLDQIDFDPERFHVADTVLSTVRDALAIALGSNFERAFREWLSGCAYHSVGDAHDRKIRRETWADLKKRFGRVREFDFSDLPNARELDCLVLLCNALRHGGGPSVAALFADFPELFSDDEHGSMAYFVETDPELLDYHIRVTPAVLQDLGGAVVAFWDYVGVRGEGVAWFLGDDRDAAMRGGRPR